jgi:hypothetical protein
MFVVIDKVFADGCKAMAIGAAVYALAGHAGLVFAQESTADAAVEQPAVEQHAAEAGKTTTEPATEPPSVQAAATAADTAGEPPVVEASAPTTSADGEEPPRSWFTRPPLTATWGVATERWSLTLYGFVEADFIVDTTRSYDDAIGSTLVARSDTYAGTVGRTQFSVRNSRLGLLFAAPRLAGIEASALLEADFFGDQPRHPASEPTSERTFFDSPALRLRHAYLQLQNDYVDVLAGQTYAVFGWQNYFFPCSLEFLGLPNQLFSRNAQLRLAHTFRVTKGFSIDVAAAGVRPAQRDSSIPDAQAGVRLGIDSWKGISTPGNTGTLALPLSIGVSGTLRRYEVNAFAPPPTQRSNGVMGWGVSVDALVPVIPAAHVDDRGNRLTLTGSFVTGTGIGDLITADGGATFPTLPNPAQANPPPLYQANIDDGLVSFDTQGVVHTIDWWAFRAGLQYYLPPTGRFIVSANYTQARSGNMAELFPRGGAEIDLLARVADRSHYGDINLLWDATPAVRLGLSGQYTKVAYLDGDTPHNLRVMGQALYAF